VTLTWLLLAAALALAGGSGERSTRRNPMLRRPLPRLPVSRRTLQWVAGAAAATGCVAMLGVSRGAIAAVVAAPVAGVVARRLHERPQRVRPSPSLALALDLVAISLRAGQPLSAALILAAPAADAACGDRLAQVGGLLRLGADAAEAWRVVADDPALAPVAAAAVRSANSGVRLAGAFERLAADVRSQLRSAAEARAQRAGVLVAAPLGLCFLPSFVCLGIIPVIVGIAGGVLSGSL
jgi:Flp pilus assembly protein TadB